MIRRQPGTFRSFPKPGPTNVNAWDRNFGSSAPIPANGSQFTAGITILDPISTIFTPSPTSDRASIIGFSVSARLALMRVATAPDNTSPTYGRLGKILAGITTRGQQTGTAVDPESNGVLFLPDDLSLVGDLWNPINDPLPPSGFTDFSVVPIGLQISLSLTLPQPISIASGGTDLLIGMWILPSLISASQPNQFVTAVLLIKDAIWSLVYDDGAK